MIKKFIKKTLKWTAIGFALVIGLGFIPSTFGAYGLFWERWTTSILGNPLNPRYSWYEPLELSPGNFSEPLSIIAPENSEIPIEVFKAASDYAEEHSSKSLVVQHKGQIVFENYWKDTQPDSLFGLHSLTKTMNALLMGHAISDGFIESVDVKASTYIDEWKGTEKDDITIRNLLNMAGGLKEDYDFSPSSQRIQRIMGTDIVSANLNVGVDTEPGTVFSHVNPNSQMLGIIIQRATGQRYSEYFSEKIWKPLGARDAYFFVDQQGGMVHTDCCMWASVRDMVRVGQMLMNEGNFNGKQVLPDGWVEEMIKPSAANVNYGMQIWMGTEYVATRPYDSKSGAFENIHGEAYQADDVFYMDGLGKQRIYIIPSQSLVILRTGNNSSEWDDAKLPNLFIEALK